MCLFSSRKRDEQFNPRITPTVKMRYYAQLVDEESTATVIAAIREVIERKGLFCALYSDRGSHFWLTPKAAGKVDPPSFDPGGPGAARCGRADDSGLFTASAGPLPPQPLCGRDPGRSERNSGTWQGRLPQELRLHGIPTVAEANRFLRVLYRGVQ